jgi:hypothetical protein
MYHNLQKLPPSPSRKKKSWRKDSIFTPAVQSVFIALDLWQCSDSEESVSYTHLNVKCAEQQPRLFI